MSYKYWIVTASTDMTRPGLILHTMPLDCDTPIKWDEMAWLHGKVKGTIQAKMCDEGLDMRGFCIVNIIPFKEDGTI